MPPRALALAVVLGCCALGCFAPDFQDGLTPCGPAGECPGTLLCAADKKCYRAGVAPAACNPGFERASDGRCVDVDECQRGSFACDANATCANTSGSYTCTCAAGWSGDGKTCTDVNECTNGTAVCDAHATCQNRPGSYGCACNQGWTGDGKTCSQSFTRVAIAGDHACGLRGDGALFCWGENGAGQLGAGQALAESHVPIRVGTDLWTSVAVAPRYTCGIKADSTLWCWGDDGCAVIGDGGSNMFCDGSRPVYDPYPTGGTAKWRTLATSYAHACAIQIDGSLWCWGENFGGDLGTNDDLAHTSPARVGSDTPADKDWSAITVGDNHSCGLRGGHLWCWGDNGAGQLGDADAEPSINFPKPIGTSASWTAIAAGDAHTCGVLSDHTLACWGSGDRGQLGNGQTGQDVRVAQPTPVPGSIPWVDVAAGLEETCGRTSTGGLFCFGGNTYGQIGDGTFDDRASPTSVTRATDWATVSVGSRAACATKSSGQMWCWGINTSGEIGVGTGGQVSTPTDVAGSGGFSALAGGAAHQCGIKSDKSLWCWGSNVNGQLGIGTTGGYRDVPVPVSGGGAWTAVSAGDHSTCGVQQGGALYCWGANFYGELGIGSHGSDAGAPVPQAISGGGTWSKVSVREIHACGIRADGTLACWGSAASGRLGLGDLPANATVDSPATVGNLATWTQITVGSSHSCGVAGGALYCWGDDGFGQLGNGTMPPQNLAAKVPQPIGNWSDWTALSAGQYHTCGLRSAQANLFCWGYNYYGQVGDGSSGVNANAWDLSYVSFGRSWLAVAAGDYTTCAVAQDATLWCWGSNGSSLVGNGDAGDVVVTPVKTSSTPTFAGATLLSSAGCALHTDGSYACWGQGSSGQFGDGAAFYETPVRVREP